MSGIKILYAWEMSIYMEAALSVAAIIVGDWQIEEGIAGIINSHLGRYTINCRWEVLVGRNCSWFVTLSIFWHFSKNHQVWQLKSVLLHCIVQQCYEVFHHLIYYPFSMNPPIYTSSFFIKVYSLSVAQTCGPYIMYLSSVLPLFTFYLFADKCSGGARILV